MIHIMVYFIIVLLLHTLPVPSAIVPFQEMDKNVNLYFLSSLRASSSCVGGASTSFLTLDKSIGIYSGTESPS